MKRVFADSGYWIALLNPRDALHAKATEISKELGRVRIVTSELVLTEVLNAFARRGSVLRDAVCLLVDQIQSNPNTEVVPMTSDAFRQAMKFYRSRSDQTWSLTDCTSFFTMQENGITEALSADEDFVQAGFRALLR